mmetsp:Transcript_71545/g.210110  ORF Transcript_71545/g.210110 Transcript_71545/m.210110 type:complete len:346 (+) Transcript_71545:25-1062(+)
MLVPGSLCRCICGSGGRGGGFDIDGRVLGDLDVLEEASDARPQSLPDAGLLSYRVLADQPLRGVPIREGELWYLSAEESIDPVTLSLYINGFSLALAAHEVSVSLSPFSLVRNCKFQSTYSDSLILSDFKVFKVSLYTQGVCYYFGIRSEDKEQAEEERSRWATDFARAIRLVTQSLFPPFTISCDPLASVKATEQRLMAGYLMHHDDVAVASVMYCELHPHSEGQAKLALYENDHCRTPLMDIIITERSVCCEKVGISCSCFAVENHQFSTRTVSERRLWLRAISNIKVKLQNHAPSPTSDEIRHYRLAIKEHLDTIRGTLQCKVHSDALLPRTQPQLQAQAPL